MSEDFEMLARQVALRLRRLRGAHDTQYVRLGTAPPLLAAQAVQERGGVPVQAGEQPIPGGRSQHASERRAVKSVDAQAALRSQAENWSAATKLEYLRKKNVGDCRRCGLCQTRTNIVFGSGNAETRIMFVGAAPDADEDRAGALFVGRSGKLFDGWISDLGMSRGDVYIANVLKCRTPENRDPRTDEVERCSPFLRAQIRAIRPAVVVGLGRHAGGVLSRRQDMSIGAMRGARLEYDATSPKEAPRSVVIPLVVTYDPAYLLRQNGSDETDAAGVVMTDLRRALDIAQQDVRGTP
ncbi:MAG: uracil-DNA glycosylase [Nannocystaceae bacterium]|nr:uracil-DNA glycosylase [Nannocystaceae bacterium]